MERPMSGSDGLWFAEFRYLPSEAAMFEGLRPGAAVQHFWLAMCVIAMIGIFGIVIMRVTSQRAAEPPTATVGAAPNID